MEISLEEQKSLLNQFLERWPVEKISQLTLEEYIDVDNNDTFAYWLEHKTRELGSIRGGDASKFGIYKRKQPPKGNRKHISHGELYSWVSRFGNSEEDAFENVKAKLIDIIRLVGADDLEGIDNIDLGDTLKWKVAFLYQNQGTPALLNIFKLESLRQISNKPKATFPEAYRLLMAERGSKNVIEYGFDVYKQHKAMLPPDDYDDVDDKEHYQNNKSSAALNTILYGPPGTGKTYSTISKAIEIIEPKYWATNLKNRAALKQRFDELVKSNRIGFVTFHQSFSYEDFVEGIKANTDENGKISYDIEEGIFKQMCDAASSRVVTEESDLSIDVSNRNVWKMSLGNTQGEDAYVYDHCIEHNYIALGYGGTIDFSGADSRKEITKLYRDAGFTIENESYDYNVTSINYFKNHMNVGDLVIVSDGNQKFRAIAEVTSEYYFEENETGHYCQLRKVRWLKVYSPSLPTSELFSKNLSQQTIYSLKPPTLDITKLQTLLTGGEAKSSLAVGSNISGYAVTSISSEVIEFKKPNGSRLPLPMSIINELVDLVKSGKGTTEDIKNKTLFDKVETNLEKYLVNGYNNLLAQLVAYIIDNGLSIGDWVSSDNRVLIIDEINRGNIANIFGELITLIEPSKRAGEPDALSVILPYTKKPFSVPSNLYLLGTMNTADKSLAQVDIALRRRFEFVEMMPDYEVLKSIPKIQGIDISRLAKAINQRIELLFDREHTIGHSFFLPLISEPTIEKLGEIFELQILPLLEEYFFEDWERVGQVLGDHLKAASNKAENDHRFIIEKYSTSEIAELMGSEWEPNGVQAFIRNDYALTNPDAYIACYEPR